MRDQSEVALEIEDALVVGHGHACEVDPSHVPQCHKDMFALGTSHVLKQIVHVLNYVNKKSKGIFKQSPQKCQKC